ncbi:MAG: hypothetical protein L6Q77_06170 [Bacteroidetes bacterium]|nr:hypothetical protein [Bacteroidota bacterium]
MWRISWIFYFLLVLVSSGFSENQSGKPAVVLTADQIRGWDDTRLDLLKARFDLRLSGCQTCRILNRIEERNDSLFAVLSIRDRPDSVVFVGKTAENTADYTFLLTAAGTLSLLTLLYFVRF